MIVVDVTRLMIGVPLIGFVFFAVGLFIGRRIPKQASTLRPARGSQHFHGHLSTVHRRIERQINAAFTALEELMTSQTQRLIDEMHSVETKLDGYVSIIDHNSEFMATLLENLGALKDQPTPAAVDTAIASLESHLQGVGVALDKLSARTVPIAPDPASLAVAAVPEPVVLPGAAPTTDPTPTPTPTPA